VGAIVFRGDAVLLVKRASEPHAGRWSLPGGRLEAGETVEAAVVREVAEETGLAVRPLGVSNVTDYVERAADGRVRWHYVLIDLLCEPGPGEPRPATDASDARFVPLQELAHHDVIRSAVAAIEAAARTRSP
jgi:ADP-ribose pyrophosphatase YjhB (NUDIX family)